VRTYDTDLLITRLCVDHPRPQGQDPRERALDIMTLLVKHIDDAQEDEARARAAAAAQHVGFYTFSFVDDEHRDNYRVQAPALEDFARVHQTVESYC
jgi:O-phosphoseryl-tRNA(Cys) synthetase